MKNCLQLLFIIQDKVFYSKQNARLAINTNLLVVFLCEFGEKSKQFKMFKVSFINAVGPR